MLRNWRNINRIAIFRHRIPRGEQIKFEENKYNKLNIISLKIICSKSPKRMPNSPARNCIEIVNYIKI